MCRAKRILSPTRSAAICIGALLLGACSKQEPASAPTIAMDEPANELRWAQAALERNPELKVVSVDKDRNSIKVLIKASGETTNVTPGELAAIPIGDLVVLNAAVTAARESAPKVTEDPIPTEVVTRQAESPPDRTASDYKVEHQDGRLRISGPGVSVESTGATGSASARSTQQKFDEPIICEGPRMLHLDRRHLHVDGDAIIVRGGCELHLTNSQVSATGTAIVVQDATVHIANSTVEGTTASFDAGPAAKVFLQNTRFAGTPRRDTQSKINDQGGNIWR